MTNNKICLICEMGQLTLHTKSVTVEYLGQQGKIDSQYTVCDYCGTEQASTDEARFNKHTMIAFKKHTNTFNQDQRS